MLVYKELTVRPTSYYLSNLDDWSSQNLHTCQLPRKLYSNYSHVLCVNRHTNSTGNDSRNKTICPLHHGKKLLVNLEIFVKKH